jgi:hydroxymethylglutaryl-CoA reductase (NADPH)
LPTGHWRAQQYLNRLFEGQTREELREKLSPKTGGVVPKLPPSTDSAPDSLDRRWEVVGGVREAVLDPLTRENAEAYQRNIENFIGTVKVPVGVIGPLRVNGTHAQGDYFVPLATTEAALVASYHRGARLITEAGGCSAVLLNEGVGRAPAFAFQNVRESGEFAVWVLSNVDAFRSVAESTTRHGRLLDVHLTLDGNHVYVHFEFVTGDASGQNMVTLATEAVCRHIEENSPVKPKYWFVEGNLSGDKKACFQSYVGVRGKRVTAETVIPASVVQKRLRTTPARLVEYWAMSAVGGVLSGTVGVEGHYANGLTALYLACGQDVACVAESTVGITRFEKTDEGDLYASVTLPNLMVGSVGGGTGLPSQRACLELMGLAGPDKARALAEVTAGVLLAGELSITGALCSGDFARAHRVLARQRKAQRDESING